MGRFATASLSPRTIAWCIEADGWDQLRTVVMRNCSLMGGAANLLVLNNVDGLIEESQQELLVAYDPDVVVLAPRQTLAGLRKTGSLIKPFAVLNWEERDIVGDPDAWGSSTGENAKLSLETRALLSKNSKPLVAVWDPLRVDESRFAYMACGDLIARTPMMHVVGDKVELDARGARECFLEQCISPGFTREDVGAKLVEGEVVGPPNLSDLARMIADEYKFPFGDPVARLEASCSTCFSLKPRCLASLTLHGLTRRWEERLPIDSKSPNLTILVSDTFGIDEALLFWNLRGCGRNTAWLSFSELENEIDRVAEWLESDYGGDYYAFANNHYSVNIASGARIGFSAEISSLGRLQQLVTQLSSLRKSSFAEWATCSYDDCRRWDSPPLMLESKAIPVSRSGGGCVLHYRPDRRLSSTSRLTLRINWANLLLPKSERGFRHLVSSESVTSFGRLRRSDGRGLQEPFDAMMPKFRKDASGNLRAQVDGNSDIILNFNNPNLNSVLDDMFQANGFSKLSPSSTAMYHEQFCRKSGGLEEACRLLGARPYRNLLELLRDNVDKNLPGWIIDRPSRRRAIHHYHALSILDVEIPPDTKDYIDTVSDQLPGPIAELIEKGIIDRGFLLSCKACSYKGWYSPEVLGRRFACTRCDHRQKIRGNPLWLYKLSEVVFQGFADNMQVPILTLGYFKRRSRTSFSWVSDSNVDWMDGALLKSGNLDLLFACDGKLYLGEAKSSDHIPPDQLDLYRRVASQLPVDGLVFSTSRMGWSPATQSKIEAIKKSYRGHVIIVTGEQIYNINT